MVALRVATFNVAFSRSFSGELESALDRGGDEQIAAVQRIVESYAPDVLLLNEVDYSPNSSLKEKLAALLSGTEKSAFRYVYFEAVNTGVASGFDLDRDGIIGGAASDAWGFGAYPGQYGMMLLSRYPIDFHRSRTFKNFLWKDFPDAHLPKMSDGSNYYSNEELALFPLSSKSHWDVCVNVEGVSVRFLCSHPTPPVFDGAERRNFCRNQDEINFWRYYLDGSSSIVDDLGNAGGLTDSHFVLLGDLNASPSEGDSHKGAIRSLLNHPKIGSSERPRRSGWSGRLTHEAFHTASWKLCVDYVLPSASLSLIKQEVVWPDKRQVSLLNDCMTSSDHRMVYADLLVE
ncbi:endonuclease/exonuclease/phosphatase family protein [Marinomonas balearica]|uniref:Endonuclease/exonuclease/phosphatase family protein n=1 Tax=Marinomonas balearica TaxID=491947 RepID=A0A4R6MAT4_9GAMM|nr:endonuclease/exonuclease/phosphatase family protein [Marinomonas balearica]TDO98668.1 endonuclease/exonuclease/phosphatase family protein [Marinomonas balearica]